MFGPCFVVQYLVSFLVLHSSCLESWWMSFDCNYSVSLPHGALGWSVMCDCGISCSFSLFENSDFHSIQTCSFIIDVDSSKC